MVDIHPDYAPPVSELFQITPSLADIKAFLGRPRVVDTFTSIANPPHVQNYLDLYLTSSIIANKWANLARMRATVCLRVQVTCAPYVYGAAAVGYMWSHLNRTAVPTDSGDWPAFYWSRNMTILDFGSSPAVDIRVPFSHQHPWWDMYNFTTTSGYFPEFYIGKLAAATDASTGGAGTFSGTVTLWLEDVEVDVPVVMTHNSEITSTAKGPISGPASSIAMVGRWLSKVPVIGPFARAADIGFSAVSSIAKIFGFSKPLDLDEHTTVGFPSMSMAIGNDQYRSHTLDPQNQISLDPRLFGEVSDPLAFANVVGRFGIIYVNAYTSSTSDGVLVEVPVDPGFNPPSATAPGIQLTPLAFGSLCFRYWRGSLRYRIIFVCSKYHRARFRISWNPAHNSSYNDQDTSYATFNHILAVTCSTQIDVTVPWMAPTLYAPITMATDTGLSGTNGNLVVTLVDQILAPNTGAPIFVFVAVAAGDDFELSQPSTSQLGIFHRDTPNVSTSPFTWPLSVAVTPYAYSAATTYGVQWTPIPTFNNESLDASNTDQSQVVCVQVTFGKSVYVDRASQVSMGERFASFRPLLKRMCPNYVYSFGSGIGDKIGRCTLGIWPLEPSSPFLSNGTTQSVIASNWTYLGWLGLPFKGIRGSVRVNAIPMLVAHTGELGSTDLPLVYSTLVFEVPGSTGSTTVDSGSTSVGGTTADQAKMSMLAYSGGQGWEVYNPKVGQAIRMSIPHNSVPGYWVYNLPSLMLAQLLPSISLLTYVGTYTMGVSYHVHYATGEDFTVVGWAGIPFLNMYYSSVT